FKKRKPPLITIGFLHGLSGAEFEPRLPSRFYRPHAGTNIFLRLQQDVLFDLRIQPIVSAITGEHAPEPDEELPQTFHGRAFHGRSSAFSAKKRAMISAVCSQSRVSSWSCFRPARVRRQKRALRLFSEAPQSEEMAPSCSSFSNTG